jgi:hypothetical protein
MQKHSSRFNAHDTLHELKHYLTAQAPLKDFIHHTPLHAFRKQKFHDGLRTAHIIFGYKVYLQLQEFRRIYAAGIISEQALERVIDRQKCPTYFIDANTNV